MTEKTKVARKPFYVVQFIELPFEGIDDYVCVPSSWVFLDGETGVTVAAAYPRNEHTSVTKDRAKKGERRDDGWRFYRAINRYQSDTYEEADRWIAIVGNNLIPSVAESSRILPSARRNCSSKSRTNQSPNELRESLKRPVQPEVAENLNAKRLKQNSSVNNHLSYQSVKITPIQETEAATTLGNRKVLSDRMGKPMNDRHSLERQRQINECMTRQNCSPDEAYVETRRNIYPTGSDSGSRQMTAQNKMTLTNKPVHPRIALEQEILNELPDLLIQMRDYLRQTTEMRIKQYRSIHEIADMYRAVVTLIEKFNAIANLSSVACSSSRMAVKIPQVAENRYTRVTEVEDSSANSQHNVNTDIEVRNKKKTWKFVLPPEYDPHDSKWTLKYPKNLPGLIQLLPQSGVYVSSENIKYAEQASDNCETLARKLLPEVFSQTALSVCLSMTEQSQAFNNAGSEVRPSLDVHAFMVLFHFVLKCGYKRGWETDTRAILDSIHSDIQRFRFRFGIMVQKGNFSY